MLTQRQIAGRKKIILVIDVIVFQYLVTHGSLNIVLHEIGIILNEFK